MGNKLMTTQSLTSTGKLQAAPQKRKRQASSTMPPRDTQAHVVTEHRAYLQHRTTRRRPLRV